MVGASGQAGAATFVVFDESPKIPYRRVEEHVVQAIDASTSWTLSFPAGSGAPPTMSLVSLAPWTKSDNPAIRYFSGTAEYRTQFTATETSGALSLDLGEVHDVAEVILNGKTAGVLWKPSYRADVTGLVQGGTNDLVIRVTNQWHNRRVGDAHLPPKEHVTKSNQPLPDKDKSHPLPSGLLGPVQLKAISE